MARTIVIDPLTRIEGHLRVEARLDEAGAVREAFAAGTMVRGLERILLGRDPRHAWALAQRACGVCTLVHALASVRAVEQALGIRIPPAAVQVRNLMLAQQHVHDHVMHFYHLHGFDWVDAAAALAADPAETAALQAAQAHRPHATADYFATVQAQVRAIVDSALPGPFGGGWWGHPAYRLPPALDLLVLAHYLEALAWQAEATLIHEQLGGKNPHPNLVVGGVPLPIDLAGQDGFNAERLAAVRASIGRLRQFVDEVYLPDSLDVAAHYADYATRGEGLGCFLTWGEFPAAGADGGPLVPGAVILDRDLGRLLVPDPADPDEVQEFSARSWYRQAAPDAGLHPWRGETVLAYGGPTPPYEHLDLEGRYSWLKAPRWRGRAMEVGPLARVLVLYGAGHGPTRSLVDGSLDRLGLPFAAMYSTLGRVLARAIETKVFADAMPGMLAALEACLVDGRAPTFEGSRWDPATWPRQARGVGLVEAPRGALGHWIGIDQDRIDRYQMVVPTTWNASPRDAAGRPGAYEAALAGTALADPDRPLEVLRTVHSFDPCMACAVH